MAVLSITVRFLSIMTFFACPRSEICMFCSWVSSPSIMALPPVRTGFDSSHFLFLLATAAALDKILGVTNGPLLVNSEHLQLFVLLG